MFTMFTMPMGPARPKARLRKRAPNVPAISKNDIAMARPGGCRKAYSNDRNGWKAVISVTKLQRLTDLTSGVA